MWIVLQSQYFLWCEYFIFSWRYRKYNHFRWFIDLNLRIFMITTTIGFVTTTSINDIGDDEMTMTMGMTFDICNDISVLIRLIFTMTSWHRDPLALLILHDDVIKWKPFSVLLALWEGYPPVTAGFPPQRPVTWCFDFFSLFCPLTKDKLFSKQSRRRWFEDSSRHCSMTKVIQ